ncbi:DNA polymerase III subunit epsilon [Salmonella enterica subsp. enterica serovar Choleraesuis]|nr:DNA polymerase III subunit epsilon [Salmonella enterica subsp. enterica serovar Choleraesuis]
MLRVIDTETCGLQGGVVEIASVDILNGQIVNPMSDLVRPDRPISPQAMAIHKITEQMVANKPPLEEVVTRYSGNPWYVAHNASFDRRMLPEMGGEWICTMKLARRLWPGIKYSNMGLYKSLKLNVTPPADLHHHRALYDCYITAALLLHIMDVSGWTPPEMLDVTGRPGLVATLPFGKYRGLPVAEIASKDPRYLHWMLTSVKNLTPELRLTLRHYLEP